jgi:hypothetical protein
MAYNRENLLKRILDIQNIVKMHGQHGAGLSQKRVYEMYIKEQYRISYSSYYKFMFYSVKDAKDEIDQIKAEKEKRKKAAEMQTKLNFE